MKRLVIFAVLCAFAMMNFVGLASDVIFLQNEEETPFAPDADLMKLYILNVHAASDAMVLVHDGKTMIIDCGDTGYGTLYVKPLLEELGIDHVDYCYNTHPHDDHINGFLELFEEFDVDKFYTCFPLSFGAEQTAVMNAAMAHDIEIVRIDNNSDISFGRLKIWLYQDPKYITTNIAQANSASMIIHVTYGDSTVMITGDAEKPVFTDMYRAKGDAIRSDIIKMPHHGYNTPAYDVFRVIAPRYAVITNSNIERIESTNQFLINNQCQILYTNWGTVELTTDGTVWTIRQLKNN